MPELPSEPQFYRQLRNIVARFGAKIHVFEVRQLAEIGGQGTVIHTVTPTRTSSADGSSSNVADAASRSTKATRSRTHRRAGTRLR